MSFRTVVVGGSVLIIVILYVVVGLANKAVRGHDHCANILSDWDVLCFSDNIRELVGLQDANHPNS